MKILLVEPFLGGSHKTWAESLQKHSKHDIQILGLPGRHWKWRMYGGAVTLARQFLENNFQPDLILATSMLDLSTFLGLSRDKSAGIPVAVYFHENQLNYPWSATDQDVQGRQDRHYSFTNFTSALAANRVFFNSQYHRDAFLGALPNFLKAFPDHRELGAVERLAAKSSVLPLGVDLSAFDQYETTSHNKTPVIVWNHRWEFDKNPNDFFKVLFLLKEEGVDFQVVILGEKYRNSPSIFEEAREKLSDRIIHFGYADSFEEYAKWLWRSDIALTTSNQDFFGGSVVEAIYCECYPILPKRLAYTEHIAAKHHSTCLYSNEQECLRLLKERLAVNIFPTKMFSKHVARYDWSVMKGQYDHQFQLMLNQFS